MVNPVFRYVNRKKNQDNRPRFAADLVRLAAAELRTAGLEHPRREAEGLMELALRTSRARLLAESSRWRMPGAAAARFRRLLAARLRRVPLQYIMGRVDFCDLTLRVGPGVLIPRPETELLYEEAVHRCGPVPPVRVADLGTGSGALALALAHKFPLARVIGTDRSPRALEWARLNRRRLGLKNLRFLLGSAAAPVPRRLAGQFDLVVSNPPYIPRKQIERLAPEVRREPRLALDGGPDGLAGIRTMAAAARRLLAPRGSFVCEIGIGQAKAVQTLFTRLGFVDLHVTLDWNHIPRIISARHSS